MASLIQSLLGKEKLEDQKPEIREMLNKMERERTQFEALVQKASNSADHLDKIVALGKRISELETQLSGFQQLLPQLEALERRAETMESGQNKAETLVAHAAQQTQEIQQRLEDLTGKLDTAMSLKEDLSELMKLENPLRSLKGDADHLTEQVKVLSEGFVRVRGQFENMDRTHENARARLQAFEQDHHKLSNGLDEVGAKVSSIEGRVDGLQELTSAITDTKHQLGTLRSLANHVTQKVAALEQQREAVERATKQAENLGIAMREVNIGVQRQEENARTLSEVESRIEDLRSLNDTVKQRADDIRGKQRELDEREQATREQLQKWREEAQEAMSRFELETRGMESASQRIADLRSQLSDFEERFRSLNESNKTIGDIQSKADTMVEKVHGLATDIDRLDEEARKVRQVGSDLMKLDSIMNDLSHRVDRIEEVKPAVEAALRDFNDLGRTHEGIKDALEQSRIAHGELVRLRESQSETEKWLKTAQAQVDHLNQQVKEVNGMKPTIDFVGKEVERVTSSINAIESRRDFIEDVHKRLADLAQDTTRVDERTKTLQQRMDGAEERFVSVSLQSDNAERIAKVIGTVTASVEEAEQRLSSVTYTITALEGRAVNLEGLSERVRQLSDEVDQRQVALEKATEYLDKASGIRQEAAAVAQELEERTRVLSSSLASSEKRTARLAGLADELDERASGLRFVEKRMGQFEERLAKWEFAEIEVGRALEQVSARQATVDALKADIKHMFEMAERTIGYVRSITAAQQDISQTRTMLDSVMNRVKSIDANSEEMEARRRQIDQAERRLARADALLLDIQSSMEMLQSQKSLVDHVVEKTGALNFQVRQAEGLIEALRDEREIISSRVRSAAADLKAEKSANDASGQARAG